MAMSAVYTTVNGMILSETRGGTETVYVPDTLGSLVECRDASGTKTYSAEYWPHGEVQTSTGTSTSPWGFVGLLGYLKDLANLLYVRARHYRPGYARWQTVDPLWPKEHSYIYVRCNPASYIDPSGLNPVAIVIGVGLILSAAEVACITWAGNHAHNLQKDLGRDHELIDKLQHCYFYCLAASCGFLGTAEIFTGATEWKIVVGKGVADPQDVKANKAGVQCYHNQWLRVVIKNSCGLLGRFISNIKITDSCLSCCASLQMDQKWDKDPTYPKSVF